MPPKRKLKVPDHTISDLSAYLAQVDADFEAGAITGDGSTGSGSTDGSYSSSSSNSRLRSLRTNVLPPEPGSSNSPSSPRVRMVEEFMRRTEEGGNWLEKWYAENYEKVTQYDYIRFELLYFLNDYMPGIKVNEDINPHNLVDLVKELVTDLSTKFNKFDLELFEIQGHEIAGHIQNHHRKVIEVVDDYENKIKAANEEISQLKDHIAHLNAELTAARARAMYLQSGTSYSGGFEDSVSEEQFMADLQSRVAQAEELSSSMKAELQRERQQSEGLQQHLSQLAREKVDTEERCMKEIVELSQRAEINSMLERGLESLLQREDKAPNTEDCQKLIDQWKNQINEVIDQNSKEIDELMKKVESQNNDLASMQAQAKAQDDQIEKIQTKIKNARSVYDKYKEEASRLRADNAEIKKIIESLNNESLGLEARYGDVAEDQSDFEVNWSVNGEIPEHELLADTLPLRGRRRRRRPATPLSTESSQGPSSPDQPSLPRGGMGVIRIGEDDDWEAVGGGRAPTSSVEEPSYRQPRSVRFVTHRGRVFAVPDDEPSQSLPAQSPARTRYVTRAGRVYQVPVDESPQSSSDPSSAGTEQTASVAEPQPVIYTTSGGRVIPIVQEPSPTPPAQLGAMRFVDGQWVPVGQRSPSPPLHSTLRNQSRIPSPRARTPPRLEVSRIPSGGTPRIQGASRIPMRGTPTRQGVPAATLTTPRVGTSRRLGTDGVGSPSPRVTPRGGVGRPAPRGTPRGGMRPVASRAGTPPRPRIPAPRSTAQRGRGTATTAAAGRGRTPQRRGVPAVTTPAPDRLSSRVMLLSPQRPEPLALDVEVVPQDIVSMGNQIVCEVAVGIQPASTPDSAGSSRGRRGRRARPYFTPRTGFQR